MKKSVIILILMIAAAVATITVAVGNTSQYVSFNEAKENPNKEYHVVGELIKDKAMEYNPSKDPNYFAFYLRDSLSNECKVVYNNGKPQDFEKSEKIVIIGKMTDNHFEAKSILMKCPSKYNEENSIKIKEEGV